MTANLRKTATGGLDENGQCTYIVVGVKKKKNNKLTNKGHSNNEISKEQSVGCKVGCQISRETDDFRIRTEKQMRHSFQSVVRQTAAEPC